MCLVVCTWVHVYVKWKKKKNNFGLGLLEWQGLAEVVRGSRELPDHAEWSTRQVWGTSTSLSVVFISACCQDGGTALHLPPGASGGLGVPALREATQTSMLLNVMN